MKWEIVDDYEALSISGAHRLLAALDANPRIVLGLPTGKTPEGMYARVVRECGVSRHCFEEVTTFNLDEYVGLAPDHPSSYATYMRKHLFDHVDIDPANINLPDGLAARIGEEDPRHGNEEALLRECRRYEQAIARAGGLQLTFLGLGTNGHIAFNEPGTPFDARTRVVELTESTKAANAPYFRDQTPPDRAITMGIATILDSREIVLLASGEKKRAAVERLRGGEVTTDFPASALHHHPRVTVIVDRSAAGD